MKSKRRRRIMEIFEQERCVKMHRLASEFKVSVRTIQNDIDDLTVEYPLTTVRGRNGGVMLADWYHLYRDTLSHKHQAALVRVIGKADEPDKNDLTEMLITYGSMHFIKQVTGKDMRI